MHLKIEQINHEVEIAKVTQNKFAIVGLDAKKAFDSVEHDFIKQCLEAYNFPVEFNHVFGLLYEENEARIMIHGETGDSIAINKGVKQGDALSCGLFILAINPLLRALERESRILPFEFPNSKVKIKALAHLTILTENRNDSIQAIFDVYGRFTLASGLQLNADKTEIMIIGNMSRSFKIDYIGNENEID